MDLAGIGHALSVWVLPIISAITFHEASHALVADRLGDDTARRLDRVSLNPVRHIDPIGTLALPGLLLLFSPVVFGWAKPVPVAFDRLRHPRRDMALVAAAGPACNLVLAVLCTWLLLPASWLEGQVGDWLLANLINAIMINLVLAIFNLFPLPPLDGSRILGALFGIPARRLGRLDLLGVPLLLLLLFVVPPVARELGWSFNPVAGFVFGVLQPAVHALAVVSPLSGRQLEMLLL